MTSAFADTLVVFSLHLTLAPFVNVPFVFARTLIHTLVESSLVKVGIVQIIESPAFLDNVSFPIASISNSEIILSSTTTSVASDGPLLVTEIVKLTKSPTSTFFGAADFSIVKMTLGSAAMLIVSFASSLSALLTIAVLLNVPFLFTFTLTQTLAVLPLAKLAIFQTILWESR